MKKSFDISIVKRAVDTDNGFNISIMRYTRERIDALWYEGKIKSWKKYRVFCNKLIAFLEQSPEFGIKFPVRKISVQFVSRFESYLRTSENRIDKTRILHNNTVVVNIQVLKTLVNRAIKIDGLLPANHNPFLGYSVKRCTSSRERLTLEEIDAIRALQLEEDSIQWNARNMFLFSFYSGEKIGNCARWCWDRIGLNRLRAHKAVGLQKLLGALAYRFNRELRNIEGLEQSEIIAGMLRRNDKRFVSPAIAVEIRQIEPRVEPVITA